MPRHSASSDPPAAGRLKGQPTPAFAPAEWRLLTRLPGQVIVAATLVLPVGSGRTRRTVSAGLAGLEGVAAGRAFDSELVRAVVRSIFAESDRDRGAGRGAEADQHSALADLHAACGAAVRLLAERADLADSATYRQWVQSVAARVFRAGWPDVPTSDAQFSVGQQRFLDDLGIALNLP